jgi:hypothetical protein
MRKDSPQRAQSTQRFFERKREKNSAVVGMGNS